MGWTCSKNSAIDKNVCWNWVQGTGPIFLSDWPCLSQIGTYGFAKYQELTVVIQIPNQFML